ncbi:hypothetical protein [Phenylobacterium sp.]|uniref:hypothetical protein n=1 Tax=Phenylobacterium sp. TaxID=1871053 RepID=UPI00286D1042|nr:hypothetical protein [Phenylobacterium sp.]
MAHKQALEGLVMDRRKEPRPAERLAELDQQIAEQGDANGLLTRIKRVTEAQVETMKIVGRRAEDKA